MEYACENLTLSFSGQSIYCFLFHRLTGFSVFYATSLVSGTRYLINFPKKRTTTVTIVKIRMTGSPSNKVAIESEVTPVS